MTGRDTVEAEIVAELRQVAETVKGTPTTEDLREHGTYSPEQVREWFGSLAAAQIAAGLEPTTTRGLPDELLLAEIQAIAEALGRTPTYDEFNAESVLSARSLETRFGSWTAALQAAGLEPTRRRDLTKADVVADIERVAEDLDRTPTRDEMVDHGQYTEWSYSRAFGSFGELLEAAGYEPRR